MRWNCFFQGDFWYSVIVSTRYYYSIRSYFFLCRSYILRILFVNYLGNLRAIDPLTSDELNQSNVL